MKHKNCVIIIAAIMAILIGTQPFTQCRGDDGGTLCGTLLLMNADSTICPPIIGDCSGTMTMNVSGGVSSGATLALNGCSNLVKTGDGTLKFIGDNTYTGPTTVCGGILNAGASLDIAGTSIVNTSALQINNTSLGTLQFNDGGIVSGATLTLGGSGTVINSGAGTICLGSNNTFTGATTINAGTLQINDASLGTFNIGNTSVYSSLPANVTFLNGAGTLNSIGSITDIQSGTLQLNNSVTLAGIPAASVIYGGLTKIGAGTLTIAGSGTSSGLTIANGGTLQLSGISGSGAMTIASGGTLQVSSINTNILNIGAGHTLTLAALPGGPGSGQAITAVDPLNQSPEPSVMVMLSIALLAFIRFGLRSKNYTLRP